MMQWKQEKTPIAQKVKVQSITVQRIQEIVLKLQEP